MTSTLTPSQRKETPLDLFRKGMDYIKIADLFCTKEHVIEKAINRLRYAERLEDRKAAAQIKYDVLKALDKKAREARHRAYLAEIRRQRA
jgi:hypothetical protein